MSSIEEAWEETSLIPPPDVVPMWGQTEDSGDRCGFTPTKRSGAEKERRRGKHACPNFCLLSRAHARLLFPVSMSDESESEEWWFDVRPKGIGKKRPRSIVELWAAHPTQRRPDGMERSGHAKPRRSRPVGNRDVRVAQARNSQFSSFPSGEARPSLFRLVLKRRL